MDNILMNSLGCVQLLERDMRDRPSSSAGFSLSGCSQHLSEGTSGPRHWSESQQRLELWKADDCLGFLPVRKKIYSIFSVVPLLESILYLFQTAETPDQLFCRRCIWAPAMGEGELGAGGYLCLETSPCSLPSLCYQSRWGILSTAL